MMIKFRSEGHKFTIPIPNVLFMNNIVVNIVTKEINKHGGLDFSKKDLKILFKSVRKSKKLLHKTPLIHFISNGGEEVIITL